MMTDWAFLRNSSSSSLHRVLNAAGLAEAFRWNGREYAGVRKVLKVQDAETLAGMTEEQYSFSLVCSRHQFLHLPESRRDKVIIEGKAYRVISVETDSLNASVTLNLGAFNG